jgi:RHS repeat-associated protein
VSLTGIHADALGSTRLVMTSTPSVQFSSNYRPYGLTYSMTGSETFKYTGKMYDGVTGLYYFNARWYDPSTGRFVTQDSYRGNVNDPMTMNRYVYARDDPEKLVDPTGHGMHIMITDGGSDDPSDQIKTASSCVGDVCTVTTTEVSGGYYSQISTTYGTTTDSSGTTTTAFSTTSTDTYPSGTSTTTIWSATSTSSSGQSTYKSSTSTIGVGPTKPRITEASCQFIVVPEDIGQMGVPSGVDAGVPNGILDWAYFFETSFGPIPFPFGIAAEPIGNCGPSIGTL